MLRSYSASAILAVRGSLGVPRPRPPSHAEVELPAVMLQRIAAKATRRGCNVPALVDELLTEGIALAEASRWGRRGPRVRCEPARRGPCRV